MRIQRKAAVLSFISLKKRAKFAVREIPVPVEVIRAVDEVHRLSGMDPGQRLWPMGRTTAWRCIKSVMSAAGIAQHKAAIAKGLRHGFGVRAVQRGVPLHLIQRWMGPVDIATTAIYTDVQGPEERERAQRMWG